MSENGSAETKKIKALQAQLSRALVEAEIVRLRERFPLNDLAPYVLRGHLRAEPESENSANFVVRVYANGQPALDAGRELTPEGLLKKWQETRQFPEIFNTGNTEAPAEQQGSGDRGTMRWSEFNAMPLSRQSEFLSNGGQPVPD